MRSAGWLFLLLAACAAEVGQVDTPDPPAPESSRFSYFPPSFATASVSCEPDGSGKPWPILSEFQQRWYSRHLEAAGEPSLFDASTKRRPAGTETLRFTWLRSFHAPVIVRVERDAAGRLRLVAKQLSGAGGYAPGGVAQRSERALTQAETDRLRQAFVRIRLFELPPAGCDLGTDGAQWIFEAVDSEGYHFLDRWTPREGPAREMGELLLGLTGWKLDPIY